MTRGQKKSWQPLTYNTTVTLLIISQKTVWRKTSEDILLESESCPLVSEAWPVGELCVGEVVDGESWVLVSDPSLSWFPRIRPEFRAEESDCSGMPKAGWESCFGDRCLFSSTALPTARKATNTHVCKDGKNMATSLLPLVKMCLWRFKTTHWRFRLQFSPHLK